MTYLLDVNVLIAFVHRDSVFNDRVSRWLNRLDPKKDGLAFCAITELGVVRILPQLPESDYTVGEVQTLLARFKATLKLSHLFVSDDLDAQTLPRWVKSPKHSTDGHLVALAKKSDSVLATLDQKIPESFMVPV